MALAAGTRIGPYEVITQIGVGGMGEVYQATDTNLKRAVALKVLPAEVANDAERLTRFQREAEVLASLNHPNIAQIHGLERAGSQPVLVMELVEGPTLADRIAEGAMAVDDVLPIARQIAEALSAAHDQGIVHRDLKPANIKLRADGGVKVLDFGLAKAMEHAGSARPNMSQTPTITTPAMTQAGMVLGTAAYMSPEQAKGQPVVKRTDIWAFGCVLFEMLSGRRAFDADGVAETMAAVLMRDPDWTLLPATTPRPLRTLLTGCLVKDPRRRFADIAVVRFLLDEQTASRNDDAARTMATAAASARGSMWPWGLAAVAVVAATVLAAVHFNEPSPVAAPSLRFSVSPAFPAQLHNGVSAGVSLSPDGRYLVMVVVPNSGNVAPRLAIRSMDGEEVRELPNTDGGGLPFWASDSRGIAFFAGGQLRRTDVDGAPPQVVADDAPLPQGGTWNRDGTILFGSTAGAIHRVDVAGGRPQPATTLDAERRESSHRHPVFLPDGRRFLYVAIAGDGDSAVYIGSLDDPALRTRLVASDSNARYALGYLLFARAGTLLAQPFDTGTLMVTGEPRALAQQVWSNENVSTAVFSASEGGELAFRALGAAAQTQLTWVDRAGRVLGTVGEPADQTGAELSPDGRRFVVSMFDPARQTRDLWVHDLTRNVRTRFTFGAKEDWTAAWSPDGSRLAYGSIRKEVLDLFERPGDGSGEERLLSESGDNKYPTDWSADGRLLLFHSGNARSRTGNDLWVLDRERAGEARVLLQTPFNETNVQLSPDGRWFAYASNESGRGQVYVSPFPAAGAKWQVSTDGGGWPRWRGDGRELFYLDANGTDIMSASVTTSGARAEVGTPQRLFQAGFRRENYRGYGVGSVFDVSPDGQRFLINVLGATPALPASVTVVTNWTSMLR